MNQEEKKTKKKYSMPAILVVVWIVIIVLFAYSFWLDKDNDDTDSIFEETTITSAPTAEEEQQLIAGMSEEQKNQARIRDTLRLSHMKSFRSALELYNEDNEFYPERIEDLIPDYMENLPSNPGPGGQSYVYTGIGSSPFKYYDLSYVLEIGVDGIDPGMHITSPSGLATP